MLASKIGGHPFADATNYNFQYIASVDGEKKTKYQKRTYLRLGTQKTTIMKVGQQYSTSTGTSVLSLQPTARHIPRLTKNERDIIQSCFQQANGSAAPTAPGLSPKNAPKKSLGGKTVEEVKKTQAQLEDEFLDNLGVLFDVAKPTQRLRHKLRRCIIDLFTESMRISDTIGNIIDQDTRNEDVAEANVVEHDLQSQLKKVFTRAGNRLLQSLPTMARISSS
jgi:hypothetical protein